MRRTCSSCQALLGRWPRTCLIQSVKSVSPAMDGFAPWRSDLAQRCTRMNGTIPERITRKFSLCCPFCSKGITGRMGRCHWISKVLRNGLQTGKGVNRNGVDYSNLPRTNCSNSLATLSLRFTPGSLNTYFSSTSSASAKLWVLLILSRITLNLTLLPPNTFCTN